MPIFITSSGFITTCLGELACFDWMCGAFLRADFPLADVGSAALPAALLAVVEGEAELPTANICLLYTSDAADE